jgi:ATP-binding cassette subfamily B protein
MGVLPVLFIMTRVWSNRLRQQWSEAKKLESSAMGVVQETVSALRVVKAFGQEDREHGRFVNHATAGMWGQVKVAVSQGLFELAVGVVITGGTAAVLYIGVKHVMDGTLSVGELLIIMGYVTQLYGPLQIVANKITTLQGAIASADRAFTLLDTAPDLVEKPHATRIERAEGAFTFENVSFAYREGEPVLQDVSFAVEPGMKVGIVGPTGAGKSTLLNLLTRSYDPTAGRVLMDGRDIRDYRLADLREQFGIVLQEPLLFATTLGDNIAYARPDADAGSIEQAARAADAHGFITRLPDGYLTEVGERGASLSGGERQRVSLARAFLKDAPVLILDEPTSAVDVKTETAIIGALERLMEGRTTFMIAHRLSTLRSCDLLLTVQDGRVTRVDDDVEAALAAKEQDAVK